MKGPTAQMDDPMPGETPAQYRTRIQTAARGTQTTAVQRMQQHVRELSLLLARMDKDAARERVAARLDQAKDDLEAVEAWT